MIAVREALLNALVHRDYSPFTESCPIRIEMYPDRLEITNKGGLYGAAPRSREELSAFTGRTQSYTMHYLVRPLVAAGKLAMTNPAMPKDPTQRFIRV